MDSLQENYQEKWAAMRREYDAKAERLAAQRKMEYNNAFEDFSTEVEGAAEWTDAAWDEFTAKVDKKWQEFAIDLQD